MVNRADLKGHSKLTVILSYETIFYSRDVLKKTLEHWIGVAKYINQQGLEMIEKSFDEPTRNCEKCNVSVVWLFAMISILTADLPSVFACTKHSSSRFKTSFRF
jgi:hypothetical protein